VAAVAAERGSQETCSASERSGDCVFSSQLLREAAAHATEMVVDSEAPGEANGGDLMLAGGQAGLQDQTSDAGIFPPQKSHRQATASSRPPWFTVEELQRSCTSLPPYPIDLEKHPNPSQGILNSPLHAPPVEQ
jgi:hypothetical protein